jgi:CubicO group peptidase (beta-lactamase class C family)
VKRSFSGLLTSVVLVAFVFARPQTGNESLLKGRSIEKDLKGGESHSYSLAAGKSEFIYVEADQRGIDVVVRVYDPSGKKTNEVDSPNGEWGREPVIITSDVKGLYRIEVSPLESVAKPGRYSIQLKIQQPFATTPAGRVDQLFVPWDRKDSPGAAVAVTKDGNIVHARGYGSANLEYEIPITASTVFHVASVSKQFTAFAVALLAHQGKLAFDDDIRIHLPEMHDFGTPIAVQHLIYHTSGLRDQWEALAIAGWRLDDVITTQHILRMVWRERELNFEPGSQFMYCNTGYTLLGEIVERKSGKSLRAFADSAIFKPLGMTTTHFHDDHQMIVRDRAYSYEPNLTGGFRSLPLNYANVGATSLFTTVEDLARWVKNFDDGAVGGSEVIHRMDERGILTNGDTLDYAFGLGHDSYRGLKIVAHSGADAGYRSVIVRFPQQRFGVIILSNLGSFDPMGMAQKIADIYLAETFPEEKQIASPASRPSVAVDTTLLRSYTGMFQVRPGRVLSITFQNDTLKAQATGTPSYPMTAESPTRFFVEAYNEAVTFLPDEKGSVDTLEYRRVKAARVQAWSPSEEMLKEFPGWYYSDELQTTYQLQMQGGTLVATHQRNDDVVLKPTVNDQFAGNRWWFRAVQVLRNDQNKVSGFALFGDRVRNLKFLKRECP